MSNVERPDALQSIHQRVFDTSLDLILVTDGRGSLIEVSPSAQAILGYAPDEMIGHSGADFMFPEDLDPTRYQMRAARRGRQTRHFDCRYVHKDGHIVPLTWTGVWSEADRYHFFIGRDVTERMAADERVSRLQRLEALGQLTGGIAHDFNNILSIVILNLDDALELARADTALTDRIQRAIDGAIRGADLTRQLLAFARQQPLRPSLVDVNDLLANSLNLLRRALGEQVVIDFKPSPEVPRIVIDGAQLDSAIVNLAVNARDAMPGGGTLMLATRTAALNEADAVRLPEVAPGQYVVIEITDTGTGMTRDVVRRIFEPFFTTKAEGKGTGLGLSMVFGFIKQSRGHISVDSEVGLGTTFRLYLPLGAHDMAAGTATLLTEEASQAQGEVVLVVDDNAAVREVIVRQLKELGYQPIEVSTPHHALDLIARGKRIDLLFTDIVMPGGMDGIALAQAARKLRPDLPVLVTSGFPRDAWQKNDATVASYPLVTKPYRRETLGRAIRQALGSTGHRRAAGATGVAGGVDRGVPGARRMSQAQSA